MLIVRSRKSEGVWSDPVPAKGVTHPFPASTLMTDLGVMGYKRVTLKSDLELSIVAFRDLVKNGWHGEIVPEASPKGGSGLAREPSKISGSNNLELLWSLEGRCWPGWLSTVPIVSCPSTCVSHTMATQLAVV